MEEMVRIPVVIYRGGTSKAIFLRENVIPSDADLRDRLICALFGSPDKRQIDGLGGADPLTSKLAIIGPPSRPDADVDYTIGQVDILTRNIDYSAVCGNISAAVGPYAIDEGFVRPEEPRTTVRIHCANVHRMIEAYVPVENQRVKVYGDYAIDGVPGTGAKIELNWADMVGANTGALLPTGNPRDTLEIPGLGPITVSIVDVGNPGVFVRADALGLRGTETPEEIDPNVELIKACDAIAEEAGKKIGHFALLTFVAPPSEYSSHVTGQAIRAEDADVLVRMIFMGKMHKTFAASQINCCGAAALIPGTLVNEAASGTFAKKGIVRLGHPAGIAELEATLENRKGTLVFSRIAAYRTARRLMEGYAFIRRDQIEQ
jgi:2-methylaconitate cis-trans-isomerase PrpF